MMISMPALRISAGLVAMTLGLLLASHFLGLLPSEQEHRLRERQQFCETLAVQMSLVLRDEDTALAPSVLSTLTQRNPDVRSAALRRTNGELVAATDAHPAQTQAFDKQSTSSDFVKVPIHSSDGRWGAVEVFFDPMVSHSLIPFLDIPVIKLMLFVALIGALLFYVFVKRALKHLDPSNVIPARVKATLDVLAEGVVLIDDHDNVVLANESFAKETGFMPEALLGRTLSDLPWIDPKSGKQSATYAWTSAVRERKNQAAVPMQFRMDNLTVKTFMVNSAPIIDNTGKVRGAIATFDDVTKLEQTNAQLEAMLQMLKDSQDKVNQKNQELQFLASVDPLTGCLNRRTFFDRLDTEFDRARRTDTPLCCIMCDIDHFKLINDEHGHAKGDQVIEAVAKSLRSMTRDNDIIARYGGEEFCIVLPGMDLKQAHEAAERLRKKIEENDTNGIRVTASFGLSALNFGATSSKQLLRQSDSALYEAKRGGRNQVVLWKGQSQLLRTKDYG